MYIAERLKKDQFGDMVGLDLVTDKILPALGDPAPEVAGPPVYTTLCAPSVTI